MAKLTSFGTTQGGTLVYRNTGQIAPEKYYAKGSSVYSSETGRRVGYVKDYSRLTKSQKERIDSAERSRQRAYRRRYRPPEKRKPRKPSQKAREPKVPPTEEYLEEYRNLLAEYAKYLKDTDARITLSNATIEECEMLHMLAYDVYETFIQYGEQAGSGEMSPHQRATFERQGKRLASLLKALR